MKTIKNIVLLFTLSLSQINANTENPVPGAEMVTAERITPGKIADVLLSEIDLSSSLGILTTEEWDKLDCDLLLKKLNRTQTFMGFTSLKNLFLPVSQQEIKVRQDLIKELNQNPKFRLNAYMSLKKLKALESDLLSIYNEQDTLADAVKRHVNWNYIPELNTNKLALTASAAYVIYRSAMSVSNILFGSNIFYKIDKATDDENWSIGSVAKNAPKVAWDSFKETAKQPFIWHSPFNNVFKDGTVTKDLVHNSNENNWSVKDFYTYYNAAKKWSPLMSGLMAAGSTIGKDVMWGIMISESLHTIKKNHKFFADIKLRVSNISSALKVAKDLYTLQTPFIQTCAEQANLTNTDIDELDKYILSLEEKLSSGNKYVSYLFVGSSCAVYNELMAKKEEIYPVIKFLGLVDAYTSISILSQETTNNNLWTFAEFITNDTPHISLEDFWLPLIPGKAISNSIELSSRPHGIFTGPNGSGKSTVMKGIAFSILLAQSWGIVPASHAVFTPFHSIRTYLNITEDLEANKSAFMMQSAKMAELLSHTQNLKHDQFCLLLIDEPFTGTIETEAADRVCRFGIKIGLNPNVSSIIATHLEKPIYLSNEPRLNFQNFHLGLVDNGNSFTKTFKLESGAANWWFKEPKQRSKYVDWLANNL